LARFRSKGVSSDFTDKIIAVPSNDAWYQSFDQLFAAGVVTAATPGPERYQALRLDEAASNCTVGGLSGCAGPDRSA
jgi:hypothetical protein